ncbi:ZIP family metal transporter [Fodinicurvata fenggangensis]|uniref:ZIP family metal transporter n=1 Tax=Fodinicurvata fenggangensis TaxID=1121830 RepID=UPI00047EC884|nr:divalent cation transporter [Fodinicurvata fenggangensis]
MPDVFSAVAYAFMAGATIPLGGFAARIEDFRPQWLETEFRHSVIAFGGGALLAAVALVLIPEGMKLTSPSFALPAFTLGGVCFFVVDYLMARAGGSASQLMAMLLDFVPESLALGAMLATGKAAGLLLAGLIALQNLPEGFNAYRELRSGNRLPAGGILAAFCAIVLLGPLAAWIGFSYLHSLENLLGSILFFAAGGILYLNFQDIAPQAHLERHWAPPLGAVAGFLLGLWGHMLLH